MTHRSPSFLNDLLEADAQACAHGCGLEPRLLEMLIDRDSQARYDRQRPGNIPEADRPTQEGHHARR